MYHLLSSDPKKAEEALLKVAEQYKKEGKI